MENDYEMSDNMYSIKPTIRSKRLHSQLTPMESNGLEMEYKRFKYYNYSNKFSGINSEKNISPVFGLNQSNMDVQMNYGPYKKDIYRR